MLGGLGFGVRFAIVVMAAIAVVVILVIMIMMMRMVMFVVFEVMLTNSTAPSVDIKQQRNKYVDLRWMHRSIDRSTHSFSCFTFSIMFGRERLEVQGSESKQTKKI